MKKQYILILALSLTTNVFSQLTTTQPADLKSSYLQNSKNQKAAGWWLFGGGFALTTTGLFIGAHKATEDVVNVFTGIITLNLTEPQNNYTGATILLVVGAAAMLSSLPLFIASGKNRRKAMALSFKNETAPQIQKSSLGYRAVPSLALKINL